MDEQTYVFEGEEVRKTGRVAKKQIDIATTVGKRLQSQNELIEIEPLDKYQDWKKWVIAKVLYKVEQSNDT